MMTNISSRHNLSISRRVWIELKTRASQESKTASEIINSELSKFIGGEISGPRFSRYQKRIKGGDLTLDLRTHRTVYLSDDIWEKSLALTAEGGYSITGLVEFLLKRSLGLFSDEELEESNLPNLEDSNRFLTIGNDTFDFGEDAIHIDLQGKRIDSKVNK